MNGDVITERESPRPAGFSDVRAANLSVVLRFLREHPPSSRAGISAATGLNKATVSSLVGDLIERGLVKETGVVENRVGRPATLLTFDGSSYAALGMEANVDYLTAVAVDFAGQRLLSWRRTFPGSTSAPDRAVAEIAALARRAVTHIRRGGRRVLGLTVGIPGLVEAGDQVRIAPNLGWREINVRAELAAALRRPGLPISVANDANLAALAEHRFGPHAGASDLAYITGEVGVGAGLIIGGALREGGRGFSGEIGHVPLEPGGPLCRCGRAGCLEAVAGVGALLRRAGARVAVADSPAELEPAVEEIVRLARAGDEGVRSAIKAVGHDLGRGVGILANVLNPQVIILGGYYVPLAPWLLPPVEAELARRMIAPEAGGGVLAVSTLGYGAAALGGAARTLDLVDSGRMP